ncbi:MAG: hypothetical protein LBH05_04575 [Deferribacteraceae bacterium]|jgi:hypothetical protein|nr:hypothetical protein [Deferribacteraceae bacterium]
MFRFVYIIFAIFFAVTILLVLVKTDLGGFTDALKKLRQPDELQSQLSGMITTDDIRLRSLARDIVKNCADIECRAYYLYKYVKSEYRVDNNITWNKPALSPEQIIRNGAGSGIELNILLSSLMENADISTRVVITDNNLSYVSACGLSKTAVYRIILSEQNAAPALKDMVRLAAGQVWVAAPEIKESGESVKINITSDTPIDLFVFHSSKEIFFEGDKKNYFPECHVKAETDISEDCFMQSGNVLAIVSNYNDAAVEVTVHKNTIHEDDIAVQNFGKEECIPFALFADNGWYTPAMDMGEKKTLVFNPAASRIVSERSEPSGNGVMRSEPSGYGVMRSEPSGYGVKRSEPSGNGVMRSEPSGYGVMRSEPSGYGVMRSEPSGYGVMRSEPTGRGVMPQPADGR